MALIIQDVSIETLRRQIGIVSRGTIMFSGTVAQNITFVKEILDLEAVVNTSKNQA